MAFVRGRRRGDPSIGDAEVSAQRAKARCGTLHGVGSGLEAKAVAFDRADAAARLRTGFEQGDVDARAREIVRAREARQISADDDDTPTVHALSASGRRGFSTRGDAAIRAHSRSLAITLWWRL